MGKLLGLCLILFSFLLQSCSSYRSIDNISVTTDKYKKIRVVMLDGMKINGRLASKDEKNIYVTTWDGKTLKIPEEGIYKIKIKKFSFLKTYIFIFLPTIGILSTGPIK